MEPFLTLSEMNILMDLAFLFQSVRNLKVMSQKFLQMLGKIVPYEKAVVLLYQEERRKFSLCAEIRCGNSMIRDYIDTFFPLDYLGWQIFQQEETVLRESDRIRPEDREETKFYQEFLKKYDGEFRLILSVKSSRGRLLGTVMLFRSHLFEDFSEQEIVIMQTLHNHFAAGIENAICFDKMSVQADVAKKVYKVMPDAMIILDHQFLVRECNASAEAYLRQLESEPTQQHAFFRVIRSTCREMKEAHSFQDDVSRPPDSRRISLLGGTASINMIVHRDVQGRLLHEFVVIFSKDAAPEAVSLEGQEPSAEENRSRFFDVLSRQYHLTRREINLIQLALEGMENQKIAETLHISLFTVKSHFQNGYAKLGVKSRQELFLLYMKYLISEQFRQEFDAQTRKDDYL